MLFVVGDEIDGFGCFLAGVAEVALGMNRHTIESDIVFHGVFGGVIVDDRGVSLGDFVVPFSIAYITVAWNAVVAAVGNRPIAQANLLVPDALTLDLGWVVGSAVEINGVSFIDAQERGPRKGIIVGRRRLLLTNECETTNGGDQHKPLLYLFKS